MNAASTKFTFNNGYTCPVLGLGTFSVKPVAPEEVVQAVKDAIDAGYRHIDCAFRYGNEGAVGCGIRQKIEEGVVRREDMFITSKLWNTFHRADLVKTGLEMSLSNLQVNYLDLFLIHWPISLKEGNDIYPMDAQGQVIFSDYDYLDAWKGMENLVETGLVKSIGVSNFNKDQINEILKIAKIKPVVNQVECHPYLNQQKLKEFCDSVGIFLVAYCPLGSPDRQPDNKYKPLEDPNVLRLSFKYGKSPAQILIRYQIQRGIFVIPKSCTKDRIIENTKVFDFKLDDADMDTLTSLNMNMRFHAYTKCAASKNYPFHKE